MNRCLPLVCTSFLAACQVTERTDEAQQATGPTDYCTATMPVTSTWMPGEALPQVSADMRFIIFEESPGVWLASLVDPVNAKIPWARHVSSGDLGPFVSTAGKAGRVDVSRPPPPPPPPDGTDDLRAPKLLEIARLSNEVPLEAMNHINDACVPPVPQTPVK
jgi:hypothetical protein